MRYNAKGCNIDIAFLVRILAYPFSAKQIDVRVEPLTMRRQREQTIFNTLNWSIIYNNTRVKWRYTETVDSWKNIQLTTFGDGKFPIDRSDAYRISQMKLLKVLYVSESKFLYRLSSLGPLGSPYTAWPVNHRAQCTLFTLTFTHMDNYIFQLIKNECFQHNDLNLRITYLKF